MVNMTERMYQDLRGLLVVMAQDISNGYRWELAMDEIIAELSRVIVEVAVKYPNKPFEELKRITVTSLHNAKKTLCRRCYGTHREAEGRMEDVEDAVSLTGHDDVEPFNLEDFVAGMSGDARALVREVLDPSERALLFCELFRARKTTNGGSWKFRVTPLLMARALGWDSRRLSTAWKEISRAVDGSV